MNFEPVMDWLEAHTEQVLLMAVVGLASFIVLMWGRHRLLRWWLNQLRGFGNRLGSTTQLDTFRVASITWVVFLSAYLASLFAPAEEAWVPVTKQVLLSGFILTTGASAARFARRLAYVIGEQQHARTQTVELAAAVPTGGFVIITALGLLQTWGAEIGPLLLASSVVVVVLVVGFRDFLPTLIASLQLQGRGIEPGRYVRLESGVEGTITEMSWRSIAIETPEGDHVHIPLSSLVRQTVQTYEGRGRAARVPFRFSMRSQLRVFTGLRARNLTELAGHLRTVPSSSVYYHTHQYLEEHQWLTPTPGNAFAAWVAEDVGDEGVGEQLAAVDVVGMATTEAARERLVGILQEAIDRDGDPRSVPAGEEFHFITTVTFVVPLPTVATNLRSLATAVRRLPPSSLYYHLFESKLLGEDGAESDFAQWARDSLDDPDLGRAIDRLNPYDYTLEGLRSSLIRLIENRLT